MTLCWDYRRKTQHSVSLQEHIENHIEFNGFSLPEVTQHVRKDPRVFSVGSMWQDTLRRQLGLQDLRPEFFTIHLEINTHSEETQERSLDLAQVEPGKM